MSEVRAKILDALRHGCNVTIKIKTRRDGRCGDLTLPLEWAREMGAEYDLMADPKMARIAKSQLKQ